MGRWAQRRVAGGGPPTAVAAVQMTAATFVDMNNLTVDYSGGVDSGDFAGSDFHTNPNGFNPATITQNGPNGLHLTFGDDITGEPSLTYDGTGAGVLTPQSIAIT